jgi:uncharacterized protein YcbK (DUF882 family)
MIKVAKNFNRNEFLCPCCGLFRFNERSIKALQHLRDLTGCPIYITSSTRCREHNRACGGHGNSMHLFGKAHDIYCRDMPLIKLYRLALDVPAFYFGGIGIYPDEGFIHVDNRQGKPGRWSRINGYYTGIEKAFEKCSVNAGINND